MPRRCPGVEMVYIEIVNENSLSEIFTSRRRRIRGGQQPIEYIELYMAGTQDT